IHFLNTRQGRTYNPPSYNVYFPFKVRIPSRAFLLAGISLIYKGFQPFVLSLCFIMDRNPAAMKGSGSSKLKVSGYKIFLLSRLDFPG
ncbi:MAG: hypothetical protein KH271_17825, partial [Clostridiales bacterium]|nr:hypothetical protein [Clostridiales bacterium]